MALITITINSTGFVAHVRCDDCQAEAPKAEHADRSRARKRAKQLAEDAGFVWYDGGKTWVCPACRIRRLPDKLKADFPKLCERYGIPVPTLEPEPSPGKRPRKRRRTTKPSARKPAASPEKPSGEGESSRPSTAGDESAP